MGKAGKCGPGGGVRPPRGPAGRGRPSPCPAVSALGGAWSRRDAGTRVAAALRLRTWDTGSPGCQGAREPGRREGRGAAAGVDATSFLFFPLFAQLC